MLLKALSVNRHTYSGTDEHRANNGPGILRSGCRVRAYTIDRRKYIKAIEMHVFTANVVSAVARLDQ